MPAHIDDRVVRMELAVGLFVRLRHAAAGLDDRVCQHPAFSKGLGVTNQAQDVGVAADGVVDFIAHAVQFFAEGFDFFGGCVLFQYDDHGGFSCLSYLIHDGFISMTVF